MFVCFVCSTLHSLRRAVWLPCAYAHHGVFVCLCLGLGCSVSCVEVAFIDVTSHVCVCVFVVLGVVVCTRGCLACPFVRSALGRRASRRVLSRTMTMSRYQCMTDDVTRDPSVDRVALSSSCRLVLCFTLSVLLFVVQRFSSLCASVKKYCFCIVIRVW